MWGKTEKIMVTGIFTTQSQLLTPLERSYENSMGKENAGRPAFSPFLTMFSTLSKKNFTLLASFSLSSANTLKFDHSKILRLIKS